MNPIAAPQPDIRPAATAAAPGFSSIDLPDLVAVVEAQLQQAIVEGRLPPGARIVEAELARQMGVSRAPVREAARRQDSDEQLAQLQARVDHMVAQAPHLGQAERVALDLGIHACICEISGNAYLHRLFSNMQTEIRMILALTEGSYRDPKLIAESHRPVIEAMRRRDAAAAEQALRHHLIEGQEHVQALFLRAQHGQTAAPPDPP